MADADKVPLYVDLDGTLIATDLLVEALADVVMRRPFLVFALPFWLLGGKASFKRKVADVSGITSAALPYRPEVLKYLESRRQAGQPLILASASDYHYVQQIAEHLGIFSGILASDGKTNLSATAKLERIREHAGGDFDYAGNSSDDLPIWKESRNAIFAGVSDGVLRKLKRMKQPSAVIGGSRGGALDYLRLVRLHQWVKNLIVFVPILTSHQIGKPDIALAGVTTFLGFCIAASLTYIINDIADLQSDRAHGVKRDRPLASGRVPLSHMSFVVPLLVVLLLGMKLLLSWEAFAVIAGYFVLTTLYSFVLKKIEVIDVICLSLLYTLRLIGGHIATGIPFSPWLLSFSLFLFTSLALVKRFSELYELRQKGALDVVGRGYTSDDLELVATMGISCGVISVLVLALYVTSTAVHDLYSRPTILLGMCPVLLYWICRVWFLAHRGSIHEDPVLFAIQDKTSYAVAAAALLVMLAAAPI